MLGTLKRERRKIRRFRVRKKLFGSAERPRLHVYRTHLHLYAQAIDDYAERTLAGTSTLNPELKKQGRSQWGNVAGAKEFGKHVVEALRRSNIGQVVFDRSGFPYAGRIRAFAETLRENGIQF